MPTMDDVDIYWICAFIEKKNYILGFHLASIDDDVNVGRVGEVGD